MEFNTGSKSTRPDFNYQMCIMSVIGILLMMLGHVKNDFSSVGTFYGWFPYYSFHMPLFFFISGYFYKDKWEGAFPGSLLKFIWKKIKTLLIPYYVINGCFLVFQTILINNGINIGSPFSLKEWLLQPFVRPEPYTLAHPTWFLIALFLSEIYFLIIRKAAGLIIKKPLVREIILAVFFFAVSVASVYLIYSTEVSPTAIVYLRSAFLMVYLELGTLYKKYLEKRDTLSGKYYFPILFLVQLAMIIFTGNSPLYYSYVLMEWLGRTGIVSLIVGMNGIALWLRISRILSMIPKRSRLVVFIGDSTKYIMSFHLMGYFLVNCFFNVLYRVPDARVYIEGFDRERFLSEVYYACNANPRTVVIYMAAGLAFSLLLSWIIRIFRTRINSFRRSR